MKTKLLISFIVLLISILVLPAQASITSVTVQPEIPTIYDDISLLISGTEGYGSVLITDSAFTIDGTTIELNIDMVVGWFTVVTPWSHTENIGMLPVGTYDLTVNTLVDSRSDLNDTFITSFEVVPEPATALLFGLGGIFLRG